MKRTILLCILFLTSCTPEESTHVDLVNTQSDILNNKVNSASIERLNLDKVEIETIALSEEQLLYNPEAALAEGSDTQISHPMSVQAGRSNIYIEDVGYGSLLVLDPETGNLDRATTAGAGPGEHGSRFDLSVNDSLLLISDREHGRLNFYDKSAEFLKSEETEPANLYGPINNDIMVVSKHPGAEGFDDGNLLKIVELDDRDEALATLMPKLIPAGMQPFVYSDLFYDVNDHNKLIASYLPLPWLFLFDLEFNHHQTIILEASRFQRLNRPKLEPVSPKEGEGMRAHRPINDLLILNNGDIAAVTGAGLVLLSKNKEGYYIDGIYTFRFDETYLPAQLISEHPETDDLIIISQDYVFKFSL